MNDISWQKCIDLLANKISDNDREKWVKLLSFYAVNNEAYVIAPNNYFIQLLKSKSIWQEIEHICKHQGFTLPKLISKESHDFKALDVGDKVTKSLSSTYAERKKPTKLFADSVSNAYSIVDKVTKQLSSKSSISRKKQFDFYSFDNFCEGKSNQIALQVAKSLSQVGMEQGQDILPYNPFFISGHSGNGKTHLMHAIKNCINANEHPINSLYQSAETFLNHLISSIRKKKMEQFKAFYRQYDVLLMDGVEFFVGKHVCMEEFFQLMNFFIEDNRQMILSSEHLPTEIDFPHRIRSRLASGLSVSIGQPEFELRVKVLIAMAKKMSLNLSPELIYLIATKAQVSIRELSGIIKTLKANVMFGLGDKQITLNDVDSVLAPTLRSINVMVTPEQVVNVVSQHYGISVDELLSKVRRRPIVYARHCAMYLMRENTTFSLEQIGHYFSRDHTSVIHALRKIKTDMEKESTIKQLIDGLTAQLLNHR